VLKQVKEKIKVEKWWLKFSRLEVTVGLSGREKLLKDSHQFPKLKVRRN
jgi:hypothetical protein